MTQTGSTRVRDRAKSQITVGSDAATREVLARSIRIYRMAAVQESKDVEMRTKYNGVAIALKVLLTDPTGSMFQAALQARMRARMQQSQPSRELQLAIMDEVRLAIDFAETEAKKLRRSKVKGGTA